MTNAIAELRRMSKASADGAEPAAPVDDLSRLGLTVIDAPEPAAAQPGTFEHDIAVALADVRNALGAAVTSSRAPLFSDATALLTADFPLATWAIVGLLTRMGVGIIGGEPKTAKTWTALIMALAVATGTKAFGEFFAEAGVAAYFFAEDLDKQVRNKLRALLAGSDLTLAPGRLHVCPRGKFLDITRDEDLAWIIASCRQLGKIDLLVLDPLRDIHSGEEDKSDSMRDVMRRLRLLGELLGCTVLVVHHTAKMSEATAQRRSGQRLRGSGAIHGSIDSGVYMTAMVSPTTGNLRASIDTEIKGARGAGKFILDVAIEDDANSEAICATATVTRPTGKLTETTTEDNGDDDLVFRFVRDLAIRGERLSERKLRDHKDRPQEDGRPLPVRRMVRALKRLVDESRRLESIEGALVPPGPPPTRGDS